MIDWQKNRNRARRAERLLLAAEETDRRQAEYKVRQIERDRAEVERTAAKQALANDWNSLFKELALPLIARTQTVHWDKDGGHPEIWVTTEPDREQGWAAVVEYLQSTRKAKN